MAATVTVLVKSLSGDLIALDVDPSLGLKGVCDALALFDSEKFPRDEIRVFTIGDEEDEKKETPLEPDTLLGVVMCPIRRELLHATYIEKQHQQWNQFNLAHYIVDLSFHRLRYIIGDTEYDIDVRHPNNERDSEYGVRFRVTLAGEEPWTYWMNWITPWDMRCSSLTSKDTEWILQSIQNTLVGTHGFYKTDFALPENRKVRCECGEVLRYSYLNTHRKTKKHIQTVPANAVPVKDPKFHCDCGSIIEQKSVFQHADTIKHREFIAAQAGTAAV